MSSSISGRSNNSTERRTEASPGSGISSVVRDHGSHISAGWRTAPYRNSRPSVANDSTLGTKKPGVFAS